MTPAPHSNASSGTALGVEWYCQLWSQWSFAGCDIVGVLIEGRRWFSIQDGVDVYDFTAPIHLIGGSAGGSVVGTLRQLKFGMQNRRGRLVSGYIRLGTRKYLSLF